MSWCGSQKIDEVHYLPTRITLVVTAATATATATAAATTRRPTQQQGHHPSGANIHADNRGQRRRPHSDESLRLLLAALDQLDPDERNSIRSLIEGALLRHQARKFAPTS